MTSRMPAQRTLAGQPPPPPRRPKTLAELPEMPAPPLVRPWELAALGSLIVLCAALRVVHLDALPVYTDEALYTRAAQLVGTHPGWDTWLSAMRYGGAPPLFSWLAAPLVRLWPDPLQAGRLTSALIGVVALLPTWAVGRIVGGSMVGLLAALLYAVCPFTLFYNRMAVLDGLVATCGAAALYSTLRLLRRPGPGAALALGLCLGAGLLSKIFAAGMLLLPVLAVLLVRHGQRRAVAGAALGAILLGLAPLLGLLLVPQTGGLLFATHGHLRLGLDHNRALQDVLTYVWPIITRQLGIWVAALWLYVTPPVLVLAVLGLGAALRDATGRLVGLWALLGGLPPALVPNVFLAPRYFVYIAVPIAVLAARGLLLLITVLHGRLVPHRRLWPLLWCAATVALTPAMAADVLLLRVPAQAPLLAFDRWQYVTGWPSGYAVLRVVAYLRAQARHGAITVVCANYDPPRLQLSLLLGRDPAIRLGMVTLATLRARRIGPGQPFLLQGTDGSTGHERQFRAAVGHPVFLVVLHYRGHAVPSDDRYFPHDLPLLSTTPVVRQVLHASNAARGAAGYGFAPSSLDVYRLGGS